MWEGLCWLDRACRGRKDLNRAQRSVGRRRLVATLSLMESDCVTGIEAVAGRSQGESGGETRTSRGGKKAKARSGHVGARERERERCVVALVRGEVRAGALARRTPPNWNGALVSTLFARSERTFIGKSFTTRPILSILSLARGRAFLLGSK